MSLAVRGITEVQILQGSVRLRNPHIFNSRIAIWLSVAYECLIMSVLISVWTQMGSGALDFRLSYYVFVAAIQFTWGTGYRLFLEVFLYLKKEYLKNLLSEEDQNVPGL